MGNFDEDIKRITEEVLQDGTVDNIIREKVIEGFENAITKAFRWGELEKAIKERVTSVLVPLIEQYDMSEYVVKLDQVLTEIVNQTSLVDNKTILEGFQFLMTEPQAKEVKVSELFNEYKRFVEKNMETSGRKVTYDSDEPEYEEMNVAVSFEEEESRPWSLFKYATLEFSVDDDEQQCCLNKTIRLQRWKEEKKLGWEIQTECNPAIKSLRYLNKFDLLLVKLQRANVRLIVDIVEDEDYVYSDDKPEGTYVYM